MPFPILFTPSVVLSEIISLLEPNEIVTASFCSKTVKRLLKRHYQQRKPLKWRLYMLDCFSYGLVAISQSKTFNRTTVMKARNILELAGAAHRPTEIQFSSDFPVLYTVDRVLGTKTIVDYAIDWINDRQEKKLSSMALYQYLYSNWYADATVDYVLRYARTDRLSIDYNVSENFRFDGKLGPAESLAIDANGHWVTLNNLLNFDLIRIFVQGSRLTVSELNSFLRHWRAGGSPRLKYLDVRFENETIFENFDEDLEIVETNEVGRYREFADSDYDSEIRGGYSIQRMDGVKATINLDFGGFLIVVWHADGY